MEEINKYFLRLTPKSGDYYGCLESGKMTAENAEKFFEILKRDEQDKDFFINLLTKNADGYDVVVKAV